MLEQGTEATRIGGAPEWRAGTRGPVRKIIAEISRECNTDLSDNRAAYIPVSYTHLTLPTKA